MEPTAMLGFGLIWIFFILAGIVIGIAATIFWIIEIVDVAQRRFADPNLKIVWLAVIIFGHVLGAIVYYVVGKPQGVLPKDEPQQPDPVFADNTPVQSYRARITSRRSAISPLQSINTLHFATFEDDNGDRRELSLSGSQYGLIAEGDYGLLHYQGQRFLSFVRESPPTTQSDQQPSDNI